MAEIPVNEKEQVDQAAERGDMPMVVAFLEKYRGHPHFNAPWYAEAGCDWTKDTVFNARQLIKHKHWFATWQDYTDFRARLETDAHLRRFEQAADATMLGEKDRLKLLLRQDPELIRMRSHRDHHSTLLNYVGANGIEEWRQRTPKNAVEIARLLLNAGAEVDSWGDMYGGTSTLGLVATSVHPVRTGIQQELMAILIRYGADPNHAVAPSYTGGNLILACLHNGRGEPIQYLASKGADVDLEGAGGLGDLDKVKSYFTNTAELTDASLAVKRDGCLIWACVYGHRSVVEFLLAHGCSVNTAWDQTTPLHSAAYGGQLELVKYLLEQGAPMEALNAYGGTVLGTTLWSLYNARKPAHLEIMETLIAAGAHIHQGWEDYIRELRG
jgi:hypothetical protein